MSDNSFEKWDKECDDIKSDKQKLFDQMKANLKKGESAPVLYRLAKICIILSKSAEKANNKELEKSMVIDAQSYAAKACKKEPKNSECHKWYCGAVGKLANMSAAKEKVEYSKEFKDHADIALKLNPNDHSMQSMYGQWCFRVASLSWIERKIGQTVYGSGPEANYDMALNAFKKVHELNPESKENHLWLAKVLIAKNDGTEAKKYIQKGLIIQNKTVTDEDSHQELEQLSKQYL